MGCLSNEVCVSCSPVPGNGPCPRTGDKVLIVDDEHLIRYSLQRLLEQSGYSAFIAGSGQDALRVFIEQEPAIVILDIHLPDTNGLSLLRTIKEMDPSVTVIMATGCPEKHSNKEAMRMGALDYLEKPVDIDHLKDIMQSTKLHGPPKPVSMLRGGPALLNEAGNSAPV